MDARDRVAALNPARLEIHGASGVTLHATEHDTATWATRPGRAWPCSTLRGHAFEIELGPNGDLLDLREPGGFAHEDVDGSELTAFTDDMLELGALYLLSLRKGDPLTVARVRPDERLT